jgi:hypothetical protein
VDNGFVCFIQFRYIQSINYLFMSSSLHPGTNDMLVSTMHVLSDGEIICSREAFEKVQQRFDWADRRTCIQRILKLKALTHDGKKSVIVFYETGHLIKEHINVETNFQPLSFT